MEDIDSCPLFITAPPANNLYHHQPFNHPTFRLMPKLLMPSTTVTNLDRHVGHDYLDSQEPNSVVDWFKESSRPTPIGDICIPPSEVTFGLF